MCLFFPLSFFLLSRRATSLDSTMRPFFLSHGKSSTTFSPSSSSVGSRAQATWTTFGASSNLLHVAIIASEESTSERTSFASSFFYFEPLSNGRRRRRRPMTLTPKSSSLAVMPAFLSLVPPRGESERERAKERPSDGRTGGRTDGRTRASCCKPFLSLLANVGETRARSFSLFANFSPLVRPSVARSACGCGRGLYIQRACAGPNRLPTADG